MNRLDPRQALAILKKETGAALMMAIFTVTMLMVIATEIMYESNVEYVVSSQAINQLKAHYAAKAGVELSLIRIQIFRKAVAMVGDQIPASMLDPIWQMPFAWPPILPEDTSAVDKAEIAKNVKNSKMQGQFFATIEGEGGKIDVNDLASPSKVIAESTREQLLQIFDSRMESDEGFANTHRKDDFEKLVNNIIDWIDDDKEGKGGAGDESSLYTYRSVEGAELPPNTYFKTVEELHLVEGMTDEIFDMLKPRITVFGAKGINVNYAAKDVLMSLTPQITEERANEIIGARSKPDRGPFKDEADFVGYLNSIGVSGNPFKEGENVKVPLIFDSEYNFRIRATGRAGRVEREITAIVYDLDRVKSRLKKFTSTPTPTPGPNDPNQPPAQQPDPNNPQTPANPTPTPAPTKEKTPVPNERPNIVYWNET